jgi:hypothetical protein
MSKKEVKKKEDIRGVVCVKRATYLWECEHMWAI